MRTTNPLGFSTTSVFDTTNRLAATVDPLLNRTSFSYDFADDPIRDDQSARLHHDQCV